LTAKRKPRPRCKVCQKPVTYRGAGRPPSYCAAHDPQKAQTIKRLAERERRRKGEPVEAELDAEKAAELGAAAAPAGPPRAMWSRGLAIGLSLGLGARAAAELAKLPETLTDAELVELELEARSRHSDLIARRATGVAQVLSTALARGALRLLSTIDSLPPHLLPSSIAALSKVLIEIQGGSQPAYGQITIQVSKG
jgi:hypothetical protein